MPTAADYLQLSTTQISTNYQLRSATVTGNNIFTMRNVAQNYILFVDITSNRDGINVLPSSTIRLEPNASERITVSFNTNVLNTLPAGILTGLLNFDVRSEVIPIILPPPSAPPVIVPPPTPPVITARVDMTPGAYRFDQENVPHEFIARLLLNNIPNDATFRWASDGDNFTITDSGIVKAKSINGNYTATVTATVLTPVAYAGTQGVSTVSTQQVITGQTGPTGPTSVATTGQISITVGGDITTGGNIAVTPAGGGNPINVTTTQMLTVTPGTYNISANTIIINGTSYTPSIVATPITVNANQTTSRTITYTKVIPTSYGIQFYNTPSISRGQPFTINARTFIYSDIDKSVQLSGTDVTISPMTGVTQGATSTGTGTISKTFTINTGGTYTITARATNAGEVTTTITIADASPVPVYTIEVFGTGTITVGQCGEITGRLLKDGVEVPDAYISIDSDQAGQFASPRIIDLTDAPCTPDPTEPMGPSGPAGTTGMTDGTRFRRSFTDEEE